MLDTPPQSSQETSLGLEDQGHWVVKKPRERQHRLQVCNDTSQAVRILIADRDSMTSDLLASALTQDRQIQASAVRSGDLLNNIADGKVHVVVIGADQNHQARNGFELAHAVRHRHPTVSIVILLDRSTPEAVVNAFRSGASGVISRQQAVTEFLDCVDHVRRGLIWAGKLETSLLLDAFRAAPLPKISEGGASAALTQRELQVARCAAKGKTNKVIAGELGLSEHTVKNYLFRAFEKLHVSNRVELLFHLAGQPNISNA